MSDSVLADAVRPLWLPGLNLVSGKADSGLGQWFCSGAYQIHKKTETDAFTTEILPVDINGILSPFASDINRLSTAAFETSTLIARSTSFPRSAAWLLINSYYAAFFAAHALLRVLGISCSQLGHKQVQQINSVADLYGAGGNPVSKGLYRCEWDSRLSQLSCKKIDLGGVHESFWSVFYTRLRLLGTEVLGGTTLPVQQRQAMFAKIQDLCNVLTSEGSNRGNWLSNVRNQVNYNQLLGVWYPYSGQKKAADELFNKVSAWLKDPVALTLGTGSQLMQFQTACNFLVGACRVVTEDIHSRCPGKDSFCRYGSVAFLRLLAKPTAGQR